MDMMSLAPTVNGQGVFAKNNTPKGSELIEFGGSIVKRSELPPIKSPEDDRFVQIAKDKYMGPSGGLDDFVNHSCEPNSALIKKEGRWILLALRDISSGEEITWDYSITMDEDDWEMDCSCGSKFCRKRIRDFKYLPIDTRKKYSDMEIVPDYNLKYIK